MSDDYTPTTEEARNCYVYGRWVDGEEIGYPHENMRGTADAREG